MTKNIFLLVLLCSFSCFAEATTYYFSASEGNDSNSGTSEKQAFKSLDKVAELKLVPGDRLLLKRGDVFYGTIELIAQSGSKSKPIVLASYGKGDVRPIIDAKGKLNGILIKDCSHIRVHDLEITADGGKLEGYQTNKKYMRCGVFITCSQAGTYTDIRLANLLVRDVFFEEVGFERGAKEILTGNGTQNYGWGIRIINPLKEAILREVIIEDCLIENVAHSGIRFTGKHSLSTQAFKNIQDVKVRNNRVVRAGGPALQASVVENIEFTGNQTDRSGSPDDSRKWGRGSGLWVWGCLNTLIEHNSFRNANGPGDSAGCHIDFNNKNVLVQYNLSENNVGGFVEILGNNHNCTYRYNVSINDGSRRKIKDKTLGAGTMMGVNGFVGFGKDRIGPFNIYLYNNTIYVKKDIHPEVGFSKHTQGVLVANNIFYLEGHAEPDERKAFLPENGPIPNVVFENNLYLKADNWPEKSKVMISDAAPVFGDPRFKNAGGLNKADYIPQNTALIKNKGIKIRNIPGDAIGLPGGFRLKHDILGNKIKGRPDMGAIELK